LEGVFYRFSNEKYKVGSSRLGLTGLVGESGDTFDIMIIYENVL